MTTFQFNISVRTILAASVLAFVTSCSDSEIDGTPDTQSGEGSLRFQVSTAELDPVSRSISYSKLESTLSEGTLVGCIIATFDASGNPEYIANSAWSYSPDGLTLTRLYDANNNEISDLASNDILCLKNPGATDLSRFDLVLMPERGDYAFYFYYPYLDEIVLNDQIEALKIPGQYNPSQTDIDLKAIDYPNYNELEEWTTRATYSNPLTIFNDYFLNSIPGAYDIEETSYDDFKRADWRKYPFYPMMDFRPKSGDDMARLNNSDFMYAGVTTWKSQPINSVNTRGMIPVTLKRQLAVIDIAVAEEPSQIYLSPRQNEKTYKYTMPRRKDFDFVTGRFLSTDYTGDHNTWGTPQQKAVAYASPVYPQFIGKSREWVGTGMTDFYTYRLMMMPQTDVFCDIVINISGKEYKIENLQRNPKFATLNGGTYYKIRISPAGDDTGWHIDIEDWIDGGDNFLERP